MVFNERELTVFYNFEEHSHREVLAYARSLTDNLREIDVLKDPPTESQLAEMVEKMGVDIHELINKRSEVYKEQFSDKELDFSGWVRALRYNPSMIKTPLAFFGSQGLIIQVKTDILKLEPSGGFNSLKT